MIYNIFQLFFQNNLDTRLVDFFIYHRSVLGIKIFEIITIFGNWQFILPVFLVILITLFVKKQKRFIIPFLVTVIGAEILTYLSKIFFHRPRPLFAIIQETDYSFPSGHSVIAITFYGFLAYVLIKLLPSKYKWLIIFVTAIIIILIDFSRVYLGVHYASDVLAGYFIGSIFLIFGISVTKPSSIY